jgi:hypothetical protein
VPDAVDPEACEAMMGCVDLISIDVPSALMPENDPTLAQKKPIVRKLKSEANM